MPFVVRIVLLEPAGAGNENGNGGAIHADEQCEYSTLELAREACQVAYNAAAGMMPIRSQAVSDEKWTEHPDRSDAADV